MSVRPGDVAGGRASEASSRLERRALSARERLLLRALACAACAAALGAGASLYLERVAAARRELGELGLRCERLSSLRIDEEGARAKLARVAGLVEGAELRRASAASVSVASMGRELKGLLAARGIRCGKYLPVAGKAGEQLELALECGALDFLLFLRDATEGGRWSVGSLRLRAASAEGRIEALLRLGR